MQSLVSKNKISFIVFLVLGPGARAEEKPIDPVRAQAETGKDILWYDIRLLGLEGQGWTDTKAPFDRFPARAEKMVPPSVWSLSQHSTGLCVRFVTDAPVIQARWTLTSPRLEMNHMPATGVSGLDLYVRTASGWRWLAVGVPSGPVNAKVLVSQVPAGKHEFLLYLPLYNGVKSVAVGIARGNQLWRAKARPAGKDKAMVFYGTSITQGGCASRPGMVHTAILGRRLDRPVINFGFSGSGRMDPGVVALMAEQDAAVFVIDCLPNMTADQVRQRLGPLVKALRQARPATPILLVEDRTYASAFFLKGLHERNITSRQALHQEFDRLVKEGVPGLHYLAGEKLLGADGEDTVDSSHPTDLGFVRHADAFQPVLEKILGQR